MSTDNLHPDTSSSVCDDIVDELDQILSDLRTHDDETPQWEFCEGFMAALICCRRPIAQTEYMTVLLDMTPYDDTTVLAFANKTQFDRFMDLWQQRWNQMVQAFDTDIDTLADERAYVPALLDVRGALASLTPEQRAEMEAEVGEAAIPSYGQIWAVGFMYAVENWPEEWAAPRDRETAKLIDGALQSIVTLTEDDTDPLTVSLSEDEAGAPSVSQQRLDDLADAIWGVYDLRALWKQIGPRVETVHRTATPGRNDPCSCGSGKKYKKCCGAN
jgi:uncharacterized protein